MATRTKCPLLVLLLLFIGQYSFSQELKDDNLRLRIAYLDTYYEQYKNTDSDERRTIYEKTLKSFVESLSKEELLSVNQILTERVLAASEGERQAFHGELEKYLFIIPETQPGREVFIEQLALIYKDQSDLSSLQKIQQDLVRYEQVSRKTYHDSEELIATAIEEVKKSKSFINEIEGLWVSRENGGFYDAPEVVLDMRIPDNDSLYVFFHPASNYEEYHYQNEEETLAHNYGFDLKNKGYHFTFGSDIFHAANPNMAGSITKQGGEFYSGMLQSTAQMPFKYQMTGTLIGAAGAFAAVGLAELLSTPHHYFDKMDMWGNMTKPGVLSMNLSVVRAHITQKKSTMEEEDSMSSVLYRLPDNSDIRFISEKNKIISPNSLFWTDEEHKMELQLIKLSPEYRSAQAKYKYLYYMKFGIPILGIGLMAGGITYAVVNKKRSPDNSSLDRTSALLIGAGLAGIVVPLTVFRPRNKIRSLYNKINYDKLYELYEN